MSNFCSNCGTPLDGTAKFCPSCGTATPAQAQPTNTAAPSQMPHNPQQQTPPAQTPPPMQQPNPPYYNNRPPYPGQPTAPAPSVSAFGNEPYIPDESITDKFFRYDNRLNRKRYLLRSLALMGIYIVGAVIAGILSAIIDEIFGTLLLALIALAITVPSCMLLIRRLHDLDRPGWWVIGGFIPLLNFALSIYVIFIPGTPGPNQYGPDPLTVTN